MWTDKKMRLLHTRKGSRNTHARVLFCLFKFDISNSFHDIINSFSGTHMNKSCGILSNVNKNRIDSVSGITRWISDVTEW